MNILFEAQNFMKVHFCSLQINTFSHFKIFDLPNDLLANKPGPLNLH